MSTAPKALSRRSLLKTTLKTGMTAGTALIIGFEVSPTLHAEPEKAVANPLATWIKIDSNGLVTLTYSKSEMGQGISTSLPMIVAEELGIEWKDIQVEHSPVNPAFGALGTGGSGSITTLFMPLRQAGAAARHMLVSAAAQRWNVSPDTCTTRSGAVWHGNDTLAYGALVDAASKLPIPPADKVALKKPEDFTIIGQSIPRTDVPSKTDGSAIFGLDVRVPGMVYAVVARCPVFGGKLKSFDASKAKAIKGVFNVFPIDAVKEAHSCGGVAVVAETTYIALQARKALKIEWENGPAETESSETLRKEFRRIVDSPMKVIINQGNAELVVSNAAPEKKVECDYELPFQAHATMEPMNCTVHIKGDSAEAWAPTQAPDQVQEVISQVSGLPASKIQVHTTFMGGGFGRRYQADFPTEAAQVAKKIGKPVQLVWSREDDMMHDFYRPASYHRMSGAVDAEGNLAAWRHRYSSTPISEWFDPKAAPESSELGLCTQLPYQTKNYKLEYTPAPSSVPRAWWRSVEASIVGFVMESYVDELAHAAGADPYEFRLRLLGNNRMVKDALDDKETQLDVNRLRGVLQLVAEKGDWGKPLPAGQGRGIACHYSFHSYVANLVEVAVENGNPHTITTMWYPNLMGQASRARDLSTIS